ncbi:hypothetical protein Neosp_003889 [[Neocosmospora] mangrovei]
MSKRVGLDTRLVTRYRPDDPQTPKSLCRHRVLDVPHVFRGITDASPEAPKDKEPDLALDEGIMYDWDSIDKCYLPRQLSRLPPPPDRRDREQAEKLRAWAQEQSLRQFIPVRTLHHQHVGYVEVVAVPSIAWDTALHSLTRSH